MKKLLIIALIVLFLNGCAENKNTVDITDQLMFMDGNTLPEEKVDIKKTEYEVLEDGNYRFYVTLKGPEGYRFLVFNGGQEIYRSEFFDVTGKTQKFTVDVPADVLKEMNELMGNVFSDTENCYFRIVLTETLFE